MQISSHAFSFNNPLSRSYSESAEWIVFECFCWGSKRGWCPLLQRSDLSSARWFRASQSSPPANRQSKYLSKVPPDNFSVNWFAVSNTVFCLFHPSAGRRSNKTPGLLLCRRLVQVLLLTHSNYSKSAKGALPTSKCQGSRCSKSCKCLPYRSGADNMMKCMLGNIRDSNLKRLNTRRKAVLWIWKAFWLPFMACDWIAHLINMIIMIIMLIMICVFLISVR